MWPELPLGGGGGVTLKATWKMGLKTFSDQEPGQGVWEESEGLGLAGPGRVTIALWEKCSQTRPGKLYLGLEFTSAE